MTIPPTTPIIVGIGDACNRNPGADCAIEPATIIQNAITEALRDAGIDIARDAAVIDSLSVVPTWTWAYGDLPGLLARRLGINPSHLHVGKHGGNQPGPLCDEAARRIASGKSRIAVVAGGEALASLAALHKAGKEPPWEPEDPEVRRMAATDLSFLGDTVATRHGMALPIHVYPMYENALRAQLGQTYQQNNEESARLYAEFDEIATQLEHSWRYGQSPYTAADIGTLSKKNRMICEPYPLLMNALNIVDLAAACVLTSVECAEQMGISQNKWTYVLGGAGTEDEDNFWERQNFTSSPALEKTLDAAISVSGLAREGLDSFDIYSCFPIVPKLATRHLDLQLLSPSKPITVLGGLTSFGGAGSSYSLHALTETTRQIRKRTIKNGLVLANGGVLTYEHAICLSASPRSDGTAYPTGNPLQSVPRTKSTVLFQETAEGPAVIETYTVEYSRDGRPRLGHIVGRLRGDDHRFLANHGDDATLKTLADHREEPIGRFGVVKPGDDGKNAFYLHKETKI